MEFTEYAIAASDPIRSTAAIFGALMNGLFFFYIFQGYKCLR